MDLEELPQTSVRGKFLRRVVGAVGVVALAAGVATIKPAALGLSTTPGFLHAVAFRGLTAIGFVAAGAIAAATLLLPRPTRPWFRIVATVTLLAVGGTQAGIVVSRGWAGADRPGIPDLVVVSYNTEGGATTPAQVAALVLSEGAEMVSLPETSNKQAQQTADLLAAAGHRFQVFTKSDQKRLGSTTSLLISTKLGVYHQVSSPFTLYGTVRADPVDPTKPVLIAVHAGAPTEQVGYRNWAGYAATAVNLSRDTPDSVAAGDFNSTIDHGALTDLGSSVDAASAVGRSAEGTWPSNLPVPLAAPIDHVLVDGGRFRVLSTETIRTGGSDHRALVARLQYVK